MHHFPFQISDIAHLTARLTLEEFGALVRLWMDYLKEERPPADDVAEIAFSVGARTASEKKSLERVLKRFFVLSDEKKLFSCLCESVLENYRTATVQSRYANLCRHWDKANKGQPKPAFELFAKDPESYFESDTGRVRKVTGRNHLVLTSESEDSPTLPLRESQPITNNQEPITIGSPIVPKGTVTLGLPDDERVAEAIYALYPKKVGKTAALKAITKVLKSGSITELELHAAVKAYRDAVSKWPEQDKTFVPHPSTWFNRGSYDDDQATWTREAENTRNPPKKEGAREPDLLAMGHAAAPVAPPGWEDVMPPLFGRSWREHMPAFEQMTAPDQRQVRQALAAKKEWARTHPKPKAADLKAATVDIFGAEFAWEELNQSQQVEVLNWLQKRKGGAGK